MKNSINITWCYPDILSLHGDRGNIMAFERICKMLDVEVNINRIDNYSDKIDFENNDIFKEAFNKEISLAFPQIKVRLLTTPPEEGAIIAAREL